MTDNEFSNRASAICDRYEKQHCINCPFRFLAKAYNINNCTTVISLAQEAFEAVEEEEEYNDEE